MVEIERSVLKVHVEHAHVRPVDEEVIHAILLELPDEMIEVVDVVLALTSKLGDAAGKLGRLFWREIYCPKADRACRDAHAGVVHLRALDNPWLGTIARGGNGSGVGLEPPLKLLEDRLSQQTEFLGDPTEKAIHSRCVPGIHKRAEQQDVFRLCRRDTTVAHLLLQLQRLLCLSLVAERLQCRHKAPHLGSDPVCHALPHALERLAAVAECAAHARQCCVRHLVRCDTLGLHLVEDFVRPLSQDLPSRVAVPSPAELQQDVVRVNGQRDGLLDGVVFAGLRTRARSLVTRCTQLQAFVDAYDAAGWRGASREKLRPERELASCKAKIAAAQGQLREIVQRLEHSGGDRTLGKEAYDDDGEVDEKDIFCCRCGDYEATDDNDIVLCDGPCDRAYHLRCNVPPLTPADIPDDEDEGWLCGACDVKCEVVWMINAAFDLSYTLETPWQSVFPDAADGVAVPAVRQIAPGSDDEEEGDPGANGRGVTALDGEDWASDEEDDGDFAPAGNVDDESLDEDDGSSDGEGSEDDAGRGRDSDEAASQSESDDAGLSDDDGDVPEGEDTGGDGVTNASPALSPPRKRRRVKVDYRALAQEMFGNTSPGMNDDDDKEFDPDCVSPPVSPVKMSRKQGSMSKRQGSRARFSDDDRAVLEEVFQRTPKPQLAERTELGARLGVTAAQIYVWFNNRRQRGSKS